MSKLLAMNEKWNAIKIRVNSNDIDNVVTFIAAVTLYLQFLKVLEYNI